MNTSTITYRKHRFLPEIISYGVWLYFRVCLSYRDVKELLFVRGVIVSYEAICQWCWKFGQVYANQLRRRRPRPGDKGHLDEVFLAIQGGTALSVASCRSGWPHPGYSRPKLSS
jgi:putative transposase